MRWFVSVLFFVFFSACSTKMPVNAWQYKSVSAFELYKSNFLQGNEVMARHELKNAIRYAKQSADLDTLSKIYLSECALNKIVSQEKGCSAYLDVAKIEQNTQERVYYDFLQNNMDKKDIKKLPLRYRDFAEYFVKNDFKHAEQKALEIEDDISKFIALSFIKEHLSNETRRAIIERASYHGYKKVVLFWLRELAEHTSDVKKREKILQKIALLQKK